MNTYQSSPEFFSISKSGPVHHALAKMHLDKNKKKLVGLFLCIAWLPLVIITAFEGTLFTGGQHSFLADVAMQVRLLLGIPMLLLIGAGIDSKVIEVKKYFSDTLMKDKEQQLILARILRRAWKMANSAIAEFMLLLILIAVTISVGHGGLFNAEQGATGSWKLALHDGNQVLSNAGRWSSFISIPLYQFMLLRWLWRYVVWAVLLFRLSLTRLSLQATHPDKAGGLGVIMLAQKYFCFIFVAMSTVISGELIAKLIKDPGSFAGIRGEGISYILICLLLVLIPPVFFARKLVTTKEEGLMKMSKLGTHISNKFEMEWINDLPVEKKTTDAMVSTSDLQDYDTIYVSLEQLRMVPFTLQNIITLIILLFIPYLPILFIHFSVLELLQKLFGMLV
jgi:hypothetical protein